MGIASRFGRVGLGIGAVLVFSGGAWLFDQFDGNAETSALKPGECFIMTDGPARGSGADPDSVEPGLDLGRLAKDEYPNINCDDWKSQAQPWLVYRVEWVKERSDANGTTSELEESCPDLTITVNGKKVTCLANMEFESGG